MFVLRCPDRLLSAAFEQILSSPLLAQVHGQEWAGFDLIAGARAGTSGWMQQARAQIAKNKCIEWIMMEISFVKLTQD
jgi:hypothetical protein